MLAETYELPVDVLNNGTTEDQTLKRDDYVTNRSTYVFEDSHDREARDQVQFYRTYGKRSGNSRGSDKCAIKITTDISVDNADGSGQIILPLIGEVSFSIPLGTTDAQTLVLRQRLVALLDEDSIAGALNNALTI